MKKLLFILFTLPTIVFAQLSVGNDQTICNGDVAQIHAISSLTGQCSGADTVLSGLHSSDYTSSMTRGWWFQAQSSFSISYIMAADDNSSGAFASNQSVEIVDLGTSPAVAYPGPGGPHTVLFSAIDVPAGWISCNASLVAGNYYGIIGAKHDPASATMYNSYGPSGSQTFIIDGNPTTITRFLLQSSLSSGSPSSGSYMSEASGPIGRVHIITGSGVTWYDVSTGQIIGSGDTLNYAPSQTTDIAAVLDCNGQTYTDTMHLEVLNTTISSTGVSLCNGPLVLTAPTGYSSYVWNGPSTSPMLTVNQAGSYFVSCTTANGQTCQSDPITIYNNIIPVNLSTPDSVFICQGDTVFIDGPSGFSQYSWSTGATTSSISTTTTGNYDLTVIDGNGCTGVSGTTTVSISPQSISLSTTGYSLCNGPVTLDAGSGYSNYAWNNGFNTQTITVNGAGTYYVTITYPTGCTAMSDTITIFPATAQFYFSIQAVGEDSLCLPGGQIVLNAGNFTSYSWNTGATTQQITVNNLGSYYVNVTDSNGCQGVSNPPFQVANIVNTSSINGNTMPTQFQLETYSVTSNPGSIYNWGSDGNIQSSSGASANIYWTSFGTGSVYVIETDINGCIGDTISLPVSIIISSIEEVDGIKKIKKITDVLGREIEPSKNTPLFYIHENGKVEKRIIIE